jgi:DedD protein
MSFFNLRRGGSSSQSQSGVPAENLDTVRKRAKHRLIGAAVLVLVGVVGFPLLFDSQPRPIPVDIAIEIPARQSVKPLAPAKPAPAPSAAPATPAPDPAPVVPPVAVASVTPAAAPVPAVPAPPVAAAPAAPRVAEDSARAKALLEDKPVAGANVPAELRLVVQVGAFADAAKAREVRLKLEKAGLKTYTQVADSKEGKRTRVRVGPFANKAEADQAALKIKALDLPATILSL